MRRGQWSSWLGLLWCLACACDTSHSKLHHPSDAGATAHDASRPHDASELRDAVEPQEASTQRDASELRDADDADSGVDTGAAAAGDAGSIADYVFETAWRPLFDPTLSQWYRWLPSTGRDNDPAGVFKMQGDVLHVLDIEPPAGDQENGFLSTREDFANYQLRVEQRWGTRKFSPRLDLPRNSGVFYHAVGADLFWPPSVEFQVQENDTGDLLLLSSDIRATTLIAPGAPSPMFQEGGMEYGQNGMSGIPKGGTYESLTDWNTLELIAFGNEYVHIVNGHMNHRGSLAMNKNGNWIAVDHGRILLEAEGAEVLYRNVVIRPLAYTPPAADSVVLFNGTDLTAWQSGAGGPAAWHVRDGVLELAAGSGDLVTREAFADVRLHLEFRVPATTAAAVPEQDRGNSGVLLQGQYEVQVLDSFGHTLAGHDDAAAIYGLRDASSNAAFPAEVWQSFDIVFRAARWQGTTKLSAARISVFWNGTEVQRNVEVPTSTLGVAERAGPLPLVLQDHGQPVRYRNIWLQRL